MSYQQPPDDPYNQQTRAASWPGQPAYPPPPQQGQQGPYQQQPYQQPQQQQPQQQQQYYGSGDAQNAWPQQGQPSAQGGYQAGGQSSYQAGGQASYQPAPATAAYPVQSAAAGYQAPGYQVQAQGSRGGHRQVGGKQYGLRGAESVWYVLFCIYFGAAYFAKIPSKKAACEIFSELQIDGQGQGQAYSLNGWETFWYILMCLAFGSGYFQKVWAKKSLWEMVNMMRAAPADQIQALTRALTPTAPQYPQRF